MKRIIVCCDGTWNRPGQRDGDVITQSNVQKISQLICTRGADDIVQLTHYHAGVGTSGNWWRRFLGGLSGEGLDANIMDAYRFIALNYEPGDHNFLFGFSRGAYSARSLTGFIVTCGILHKHHIDKIYEAFAIYRDRSDETRPHSERARAFRTKYSHPPAVYFVGVWDTVGDLGIPLLPLTWLNAKKYKFHDTQLSSIISYAYHALAIDEHRKLFNATLWQRSDRAIAENTRQHIEQVWFPGAHTNVGGGYKDCGLSDASLQWMMEKAQGAGLSFNESATDYIKADIKNGYLVNSNTFLWSILNFFRRFNRMIFIHDQTFIGQSVIPGAYERLSARANEYLAPNLPPKDQLILKLTISEQGNLQVNAAETYSAAMLQVKKGESYEITCDPAQRWKDAWVSSGPRGYTNILASLLGMRVKGAKCFCLCGLYDRDEPSGFAIGKAYTLTASRNAMICFFANDTPGFYINNSGSVNINITRLS